MDKCIELVVLSGKGGTGKTSVTGALAYLANQVVVADCDVDAADLHLVLNPEQRSCETFRAGRLAVIRQQDCIRCGACLAHCRFQAIRMDGERVGEACFAVNEIACEGCGVCAALCPMHVIEMQPCVAGAWFVADTHVGPMVHARLEPGGENSGKLVSVVREAARQEAAAKGLPLILIDGPPGIGCPVIASLTGASHVLIVTEPTVAGVHDMRRLLELIGHFHLSVMVCINKWDLNPGVSDELAVMVEQSGACLVGRIRYDSAVTQAQNEARTVVEGPCPAADDLHDIWKKIQQEIGIT